MEYGELREELQRIRAWRHEFANDMSKWQAGVDNSLRAMREDLGTVSDTVSELAKVAAANEAVALALTKQGPVLHLGWMVKTIGLAASASAVGGFAVVLVHYL